MKIIYHGILKHLNKKLDIYASDEGLAFVGSFDKENEIHQFISNIEIKENQDKVKPFIDQLNEYFNGTRNSFDLKIDINSSPFNEIVWQALTKISYGETTTYSDLANKINKPNAFRAVASAIGKNPLNIVIPCHRVIGKDGQLRGYRGGLEMKQSLLELESRHTHLS
ncbi:methylated-DNA--[protein]-cysteine S-methyltransferase [Mammaliicoccus sciuri]|uniref:methylated-DNA--[protein]-cysteine S-methyltransferase n=1 Tax=Mammaliicoccus sciuri TaxID=1296 RepID=UPI002DB714E6|nr:methylated-DNA--[protein]-cysteine S-methyltransferase [Mammaliicoccus sciuri]MEB7436689.1 methylated-DNA--[protein]-cysteine S-methyltransferase [Mammaliicoccus sciuri]MEB7965069.1 methylated-DNA--[protein]-cysteine S-methyltransferase [Mammaliicoccus sciuri]MEB8294656.1 methylated-DNA--[protein]-cysteine S-methyltransferase [Mammaliicoccus sciuri]